MPAIPDITERLGKKVASLRKKRKLFQGFRDMGKTSKHG
jgi:hypothetical protein